MLPAVELLIEILANEHWSQAQRKNVITILTIFMKISSRNMAEFDVHVKKIPQE